MGFLSRPDISVVYRFGFENSGCITPPVYQMVHSSSKTVLSNGAYCFDPAESSVKMLASKTRRNDKRFDFEVLGYEPQR